MRSRCEIKCLKIARMCAIQSHTRGSGLASIEALAAAAREEYGAVIASAVEIFQS